MVVLKLKVFQRVEGNRTNPCIHNSSCLLSVGIVAYAITPFVGQPLSKQLYFIAAVCPLVSKLGAQSALVK